MSDREVTLNYYIANAEDDAGEFVIVCCTPSELVDTVQSVAHENDWDLDYIVIFRAGDALKVKTKMEIG
jgi:hypothetical protein